MRTSSIGGLRCTSDYHTSISESILSPVAQLILVDGSLIFINNFEQDFTLPIVRCVINASLNLQVAFLYEYSLFMPHLKSDHSTLLFHRALIQHHCHFANCITYECE
ncbi:hypothetical protein TNCT_672791 [Trichonephila clavata]|uniref:Uncharacterized protein n=1 Tax=Trichonephila clavata TaxID=2740835 RepID=A0A8X6LE24_TRICU|nr:hypothetical protein TNCT_672791 [Trichonephila clavata]